MDKLDDNCQFNARIWIDGIDDGKQLYVEYAFQLFLKGDMHMMWSGVWV